jgi:methyl-accepting chemotaxis protein
VTQQNTANAEETASAAHEMASRALELKRILSGFILQNEKSAVSGRKVTREEFTALPDLSQEEAGID